VSLISGIPFQDNHQIVNTLHVTGFQQRRRERDRPAARGVTYPSSFRMSDAINNGMLSTTMLLTGVNNSLM
jgi:hypothetical protein